VHGSHSAGGNGSIEHVSPNHAWSGDLESGSHLDL
jgi:hypothetical protein